MVEICLLKSINFVDLEKWYVEYYLREIHLKSKYELITLKKIISPKKNLIKKDDYKGDIPIVDKIVFKTGDIVFRKEKKTGMNLYSLDNEDLLVSNINFHQGATALNTFGKIVASTHYQPYSINTEIIDPIYLVKILRSEPFLKMVSGKKAQGIKNESGYDFIGNFKIPVPSIPEQKAIVQKYQDIVNEAKRIETQAEVLNETISNELIRLLGITIELKNDKTDSLLTFIKYSKSSRWDVDYILGKHSIDYIFTSKYPIINTRDIILLCQYGSSCKADRNANNTPVLRMNNIQDGEFVVNDLKYLNLSEKDLRTYKLNKGDLLFNRTNSKELVGKSAVFEFEDDYVFASYLIRVVIDSAKANVHYINYIFGSKIIRDQINSISRQITGQANVNTEEMKNFSFPLPPLPVQNEIVEHINQIKAQVKDLRQQAKELREKAKLDFERSVFE